MADIIGILGVSCIVLAYFLLQATKVKGDDWLYLLLNLTGAILVTYSLMHTWNTASFIIEVFWISISVFGILKKLWKHP